MKTKTLVSFKLLSLEISARVTLSFQFDDRELIVAVNWEITELLNGYIPLKHYDDLSATTKERRLSGMVYRTLAGIFHLPLEKIGGISYKDWWNLVEARNSSISIVD